MKTLALFDFDGTLYKKDSLLEFTRFSKGNAAFSRGILMLFPDLAALKLGIRNNEKTKEKFIRHFFKDLATEEFTALGADFAQHKIEKDLDPGIFEKFKSHINANDTVYIVTASFAEWIEPWSRQFNIEVVGTKPEIKNGKLTGNFSSKNCYGIEKVNRIAALINLGDFEKICVYGSGKGDREMLQLSK